MSRRLSVYLVLLLGALSAACRGDPRVRANEAVARGDEYVRGHKIAEASIEYRRAIQLQPERADAHAKLATVYLQTGDAAKAYAEFVRATDLDATLVDAQIAAGKLLLNAGKFEDARSRADAVLATNPRSVAAHILRGNALAGLRDGMQAVREMQQAVALDPASPAAYSALGSAQFAAGIPAARASFEKAIALQPRSLDARVALANYDWATGDRAAAEGVLLGAITIDPASAEVHRALALMYLIDGKPADAEPHFKELAAQSADGKLALADFYTATGRPDSALATLRPLANDPRLGAAAKARVATLLFQQGNRSEALEIADDLIRARPSDPDGHTLKARLLLNPPADASSAWTEATAAVHANPDSATAQYTLGLAAVARREYNAAEAAFRQTLAINPRAEAAQLQLARLELVRGDPDAARNAAEAAVRARPDDLDAVLVLSRTLRAQGDLDPARRLMTSWLQKRANTGAVWIELGGIELAAHHLSEARTALDHARAREPDDPSVQVLAARLDAAEGAAPAAEQRLLDVLREHPDRLDAYELLVSLYVDAGKTADALARCRALAARAPDQAGPATMVGILLDQSHDRAGARAQYEAVLARNPRAGVAANNLAWMLAEDGAYDDALRWASVATETLRGRPEAQDTLGWIYLKTGRPGDALAAFERAASAAPEQSLYKQHAAEAKKALGSREPQTVNAKR